MGCWSFKLLFFSYLIWYFSQDPCQTPDTSSLESEERETTRRDLQRRALEALEAARVCCQNFLLCSFSFSLTKYVISYFCTKAWRRMTESYGLISWASSVQCLSKKWKGQLNILFFTFGIWSVIIFFLSPNKWHLLWEQTFLMMEVLMMILLCMVQQCHLMPRISFMLRR